MSIGFFVGVCHILLFLYCLFFLPSGNKSSWWSFRAEIDSRVWNCAADRRPPRQQLPPRLLLALFCHLPMERHFCGFRYFFLCSPLFGEDSHFHYIIFFGGLKPPAYQPTLWILFTSPATTTTSSKSQAPATLEAEDVRDEKVDGWAHRISALMCLNIVS